MSEPPLYRSPVFTESDNETQERQGVGPTGAHPIDALPLDLSSTVTEAGPE